MKGIRLVAWVSIMVLLFVVTACGRGAPAPEQEEGGQEPAGQTPAEAEPPAEPAAEPVKVTQAGFLVLYMWPQFVAKDKGFFEEEGIDFEFVEIDSGALGTAALLSGDAQFTDLDAAVIATLHKEGQEFLGIYQQVGRMTMDMIFSNEVVERLNLSRDMPLMDRYRALEGLTIGITRPGAPTDVFARYYMQQAGLDPDRDATLVPVGGAASLMAALKSGQIDAYLLSPPSPHQLEQEGVGKIIIKASDGDVPELADVPYVAITVTKEFAERNPDVVRAYTRAISRAIAWAADNRDEALQVVQKYFADTPADVLGLSWDALLPAISRDGVFTRDGVEAYLRIMVDMGQLGEMPPTEEGVLWTNEYVRDQ